MRDPDGCFWGGYCCLHHQWLLGPTHSPFLRFQDPGPQSLPSCPPVQGDEISGQVGPCVPLQFRDVCRPE